MSIEGKRKCSLLCSITADQERIERYDTDCYFKSGRGQNLPDCQASAGGGDRLEKTFSVAGGKGINVTKILRQFHLPAAAMGFLGGYTGRMIEDAVMELGAECHFTRIQGETRTNVNLLGADGYVTELLEPGPEISKEELANL